MVSGALISVAPEKETSHDIAPRCSGWTVAVKTPCARASLELSCKRSGKRAALLVATVRPHHAPYQSAASGFRGRRCPGDRGTEQVDDHMIAKELPPSSDLHFIRNQTLAFDKPGWREPVPFLSLQICFSHVDREPSS